MDHDQASRVIGRIYDTALGAATWGGLLEDIADLAEADVAWMVVVAPRLGLNTVIAPRSDPCIIEEYQRHWWARDPTLAATFAAPVGRVTSLEDSGRERFVGSEFHNDFWRRSGHATERLSANLIREDHAIACIGVQPARRRDSIGPDLAAAFRLLVPHVVRSIGIGCDLRRIELEREVARASPPGSGLACVLLVDEGCSLVVADAEAERMLGKGAVRVERGVVELGTAAATARLRRLVGSCLGGAPELPRGGEVRAPAEDGPGLAIRVVPFTDAGRRVGPEMALYPRAVAMLVVSEPAGERERAAGLLRQRFGLSPAEALVMLEIGRGDGREAVASRLGVTLATIRTHMMHVFDKVGVTSQAGLVAAMARAGILPEPVGPGEDE
ncbi:MAG TPA: helix-turn-helix transcriptional regulator [Amaricoccus sp.]|nr:helix-turn-helix transcriptional regulator [Amaricoccus sp.]